MTTSAMNNKWLGVVRMPALGCLLLIATFHCEAQNLVPNGSFEEYDTCRVFNDVYYPDNGPLGWFSSSGTPDHFMGCLPSGSFNSAPLSYWVYQGAQEGDCYAGILTYREIPEVREYFMVELVEPLVVGVRYYASLYASPGFGGPQPQVWLATSGTGMIFTTQPRQWEVNDAYPPPLNYAHVHSELIISDTVDWTLVSGSFVADSAYQYVMIGNPFDNASTDTLHLADFNWLPQGYMVIDNVCVSMDSSVCPLAMRVPDHLTEVVRLFPNPAHHQITVAGLAPGTSVRICDVLGRSLWQGVPSGDQVVFDVSPWMRGTYVLQVERLARSQSLKFVLTE